MKKNNLHLSIIPSYKCNLNCDYCYLGKLRYDSTTVDLSILQERIKEIESEYNIEYISLYGGEISILDKKYLDNIMKVIKNYNVNITTNLTNDWIIDYCRDNNLILNISLNEERPNYKQVLKKINDIDCSITSVVLPSMLKKSAKEILEFYDSIGKNVFFLEYHPSEYNKKYDITTKDYVIFLKQIITEYNRGNYSFNIENINILEDNEYNPTQEGFLFILPNGKYGSVSYDNNIEKLLEFDTLDEWKNNCKKEKEEYFNKCYMCEFFGRCKAEHLKTYTPPYCSGLYEIIKEM